MALHFEAALVEGITRLRALNAEAIPKGHDTASLAEFLRGRAAVRRGIIRSNNELINTHLRPLLADMTEERADKLFAFAERLYSFSNNLDMGLALEIHLALVEQMRKANDTDRLVRSLYGAGLIYLQLRRQSDIVGTPLLFRAEAMDMFSEGAALTSRYFELENKDTRMYVNRCLGNVYATINTVRSVGDENTFTEFIERVDEALNFWQDAAVRALDPDFPWDKFIINAHQNFSNWVSVLRRQKTEERDHKFALRVYNSYIEIEANAASLGTNRFWTDVRTKYLGKSCKYFIGKISCEQLLRELRTLFYSADDNDYSDEGIFAMVFVPSVIVRHLEERKRAVTRWTKRETEAISARVIRYLQNIPAGTNRQELTSNVVNYTSYIKTMLDTSEYVDLVLDMTVNAEMQSYVHTRLVQDIALILARHLQADEELVSMAAKCQGIEQVLCAEATSLPARALLPYEERLLHEHTRANQLLRYDDDVLTGVIEAIRAHHKWYDNQGGYPEDYIRTGSPRELTADIIAAADSIAAATDDLQRGYAPVLTLEEITREIAALSGTRYAPRVAEALRTPEVYDAIAHCVTREREEESYAFYTNKLY